MQKASLKNLVLGVAALGALVLGGCLNESSSKGIDNRTATIGMDLSVPNLTAKGGLGKGSAIVFSRMVVTLTSSVSGDAVIKDTITPGENGFVSLSTVEQTISKQYTVKPLRGWTIKVETFDMRDSSIHKDSVLADSIKIGELRPVEISLKSRFVMYVAKFTLPDSIGSATGTFKEKLNINRFKLVLDGQTVRDTTKQGGGYFSKGLPSHRVEFDYVPNDSLDHTLKLYVYGVMNDWPVNKPLYADSIVIGPLDTLTQPTLPYVGPGSASDTVGGTSSTKIDPLKIVIGKIGVYEIDANLEENGLPKIKTILQKKRK